MDFQYSGYGAGEQDSDKHQHHHHHRHQEQHHHSYNKPADDYEGERYPPLHPHAPQGYGYGADYPPFPQPYPPISSEYPPEPYPPISTNPYAHKESTNPYPPISSNLYTHKESTNPYAHDECTGPYAHHESTGAFNTHHEPTGSSHHGYDTHHASSGSYTHHASAGSYTQYSESQEKKDGPVLPQGQLVRVFCKGNSAFNLAVDHDTVVMKPANPVDEAQQWIRDSTYGLRVKDNYGYPAFALVNKKTLKVLKHAKEKGQQVLLADYRPDMRDDDILWTESQDFGEGFKTVRCASDTLLNMTVFEGTKKIRNGSALVLDTWHKGDHQLWRLFPL